MQNINEEWQNRQTILNLWLKIGSKTYPSAVSAVEGMMHANTCETFLLQCKRLENLVSNEKKQLKANNEALVQNSLFYEQIKELLTDSVNEPVYEQALEPYKDLDEYQEWIEKLEDKDKSHIALLKELNSRNSNQLQITQLAAWGAVEEAITALKTSRLSYLPATNNKKELFIDLTWIVIGAGLILAAAVLGIAFPTLIIPSLVIAAVVAGYGFIDFAKQTVQFLSEFEDEELDELAEEEEDGAEKKKNIDPAKNEVLKNRKEQEHRQLIEKKWLRTLEYTVALVGLALGVAGFVLVFPGIVVPLAAIITVSALAVGVSVLTTSIWGFKLFREQKALSGVEKEIDEAIKRDEEIINTTPISSTEKVFLGELGTLKPAEIKELLKKQLSQRDEETLGETEERLEEMEETPRQTTQETTPIFKDDKQKEDEEEIPPSKEEDEDDEGEGEIPPPKKDDEDENEGEGESKVPKIV